VVTDRHTDRQTNAGENIFPRFRGDNNMMGNWVTELHEHCRLATQQWR